jgi:tetratricopeptide (TPR) repeat protein
MKLAEPVFLRGVFVAALASLVACSSSKTTAGEEPDRETVAPAGEARMPSVSQEGQDVEQQRRKVAIQKSLEEARRSMQLKLFEDARRAAAFVLKFEPNQEEARQILLAAEELLGERRGKLAGDFETRVLGGQVALQRDLAQARQDGAVGDAHMEAGRYGDAIESYNRGLMVLRLSVYVPPTSELRTMLETKLKNAQDLKERAEREVAEARRAASRKELEDAEQRLRIQRATRVDRLLTEANYDFQVGNFERAVQNIDMALHENPTSQHALALRDLAERARHESRLDLLRQDWKAEWSKTFDDLSSSDVPQTEAIKISDLDHWAKVSARKPLEFTGHGEEDSPEEKAIRDKLDTTKVEHRFAEATVQDWASHYAGITGVNFLVTAPVVALDPGATTLKDFRLPMMSVAQALENIGSVTGVRWVIRNGAVQLVTPENAKGRTVLRQYDVRDLVQGVPSKPGRELKLRAPGDEDAPAEEEGEAKPTVVDETKLVDMIRANVAPESWDAGGGSINPQRGILIVRNTKEVHAKLEKLLADLRGAVGLQVDVETRFLRVEDSFLQEVGVDFRGLGNQASEGVPGRGLENNNRQNAGFDDYGRRELINPATPGEIGTGTEPGLFFDDGGDGDVMARTENLWDRTLGGDELLDNGGGLSLQWAYLDDTELEIVLRAVQKNERSEQITAPRLLIFNNTRASMSVLRHTSYIRDFEVEIAQAAAVANPVVDVVRDGVVLDVRPVVSADRKFITMELRPTVMVLQTPIPTFTTTLGVGQPVSIQLPRTTLQRVRTTVTMPDGGTLMLGGMKLAEKQDKVSGVPVLQDIPIVSFFFSRKGTFTLNRKILMLIRAKIILSEEFEPARLPDDLQAELMNVGTVR